MRVVLLALLLTGAVQAQDGRKEFRKGLERIWRRAGAGRWEKGKDDLLALLAAHAKKPYVLVERPHVLELARLCILRAQAGEPKLKKLITGKLLNYNRSTRVIRIEYTPGTMGDWVRTSGGRYHPASFSGSHRVRIEGKEYPTNGYQFVVCTGESNGYHVVFGYEGIFRSYLSPQITDLRTKDDTSRLTDTAVVYKHGKPFKIDLKITTSGITAFAGGHPLMKAPKDKDHWGHVVLLSNWGSFKKMVIEGRTEGAWADGLIDIEVQRRLRNIEKSYRARDHLPAWLFENVKPNPNLAVAKRPFWPTGLDDAQTTLRNRAWGFLAAGRYQKCIETCGKADTPLAAHLAARAYEALDDYGPALELCRRVRKAHPEFFPPQLQEVRLLGRLRLKEEALAAADALRARYPGDPDLHAELALVFLRDGLRDPRDMIETALANGVRSNDLDTVQSILHKRFHGPPWPKRYETKTRHYVVVTDVSRGRAYRVAKAMEQAYSSFRRLLAKPPKMDERLTVYFFRSRTGFMRYVSGLYGKAHTGSAGLYDPTLKQLILWNRTPEDDLLRTGRHEGLHQFLDSVMGTPPLWFNEGLAEYFAYGEMKRGQWVPGGVSQRHLRNMKLPFRLRDFLYLSRARFMADPTMNYARAWAWIHFLRETETGRPLFDRFWESFARTTAPVRALDEALGKGQLGTIESKFFAHVRRLR